MEVLGLAPPALAEDIENVYRERAKQLHPDAGGDEEQFRQLQDAHDRAMQYAEFNSSRSKWLAAQVDRYVEQDALAGQIRRRGGNVDIESDDWLNDSIGEDFGQLLGRIVGVSLAGTDATDETIDYLAAQLSFLSALHLLDLSGTKITDAGLVRLYPLKSLRELRVRDTAITTEGLEVIEFLPALRKVDATGSQATRPSLWKLRRNFPRVKITA